MPTTGRAGSRYRRDGVEPLFRLDGGDHLAKTGYRRRLTQNQPAPAASTPPSHGRPTRAALRTRADAPPTRPRCRAAACPTSPPIAGGNMYYAVPNEADMTGHAPATAAPAHARRCGQSLVVQINAIFDDQGLPSSAT